MVYSRIVKNMGHSTLSSGPQCCLWILNWLLGTAKSMHWPQPHSLHVVHRATLPHTVYGAQGKSVYCMRHMRLIWGIRSTHAGPVLHTGSRAGPYQAHKLAPCAATSMQNGGWLAVCGLWGCNWCAHCTKCAGLVQGMCWLHHAGLVCAPNPACRLTHHPAQRAYVFDVPGLQCESSALWDKVLLLVIFKDHFWFILVVISGILSLY